MQYYHGNNAYVFNFKINNQKNVVLKNMQYYHGNNT